MGVDGVCGVLLTSLPFLGLGLGTVLGGSWYGIERFEYG